MKHEDRDSNESIEVNDKVDSPEPEVKPESPPTPQIIERWLFIKSIHMLPWQMLQSHHRL